MLSYYIERVTAPACPIHVKKQGTDAFVLGENGRDVH